MIPTWRDRANTIVRPSQVRMIVPMQPNRENYQLHLHIKEAHFLEWPEIFAERREHPQSFTVRDHIEVHIHDAKKAFLTMDKNGNYLVEYDDKLIQWF